MSNILIIKHGSLGDIVQISGVLKDIREKHLHDKIFILTTSPYEKLLAKCPFVDEVIIDERLPRWNIFYLMKLRKIINKLRLFIVYDLQNSSRTFFYQKFLFNISKWSSTNTALKKGIKKSDFDNDPVLERFKFQLESSNVKSNFTLKPDFSWSCINVDQIINKFFTKKFIIIFPFSSPKLKHKQWSSYNKLINVIKKNHNNLDIAIAPGPNEMHEAKKINSISITNEGKPLNLMELAGLVKKSSFVISNDTGPAHMAAHLGSNGVVLFGYHTTARKVSIETDKFKAISVSDLKDLPADEVYLNIKDRLNSID